MITNKNWSSLRSICNVSINTNIEYMKLLFVIKLNLYKTYQEFCIFFFSTKTH